MLNLKFNKLLKIILSFSLIFTLSACWDYQDLDKITVVAGTAVDKGENKFYKVTIETIVVESGEQGTSFKTNLMEDEGNTVSEALSLISSKLSTKLYFGDMQIFVISKDLMIDEEIKIMLEGFFREPDRRETVNVIVSGNDKASELLIEDSKKGKISSYDLDSNIKVNEKLFANTFSKKTYEIYNDICRGASDFAIPIYCRIEEEEEKLMSSGQNTFDDNEPIDIFKKEEKKKEPKSDENSNDNEEQTKEESEEKPKKETLLKSRGCILFDKTKAVGSLGRKDLFFMLLVSNKLNEGKYTFVVDEELKEYSTVSINKSDTKVNYLLNNGKLNIDIKNSVSLEISEIDDEIDFLNKEQTEKFAELIEKEMVNGIKEVIKKCQEQNCEPFGFADYLYRKKNKQWKEIKDNFKDVYKNAEINVFCEAKILNTGFTVAFE